MKAPLTITLHLAEHEARTLHTELVALRARGIAATSDTVIHLVIRNLETSIRSAEELRDALEAPTARCDRCNRATWEPQPKFGWVCGFPQPDGGRCQGRLQPVK